MQRTDRSVNFQAAGAVSDLSTRSPIHGHLDRPVAEQRVRGILDVSGWAYSLAGPITDIGIFIESTSVGTVHYGSPREDVVAALPDAPGLYCGFTAQIRLDDRLSGRKELVLRVHDARGHTLELSQIIVAEPLASVIYLDTPVAGELSAGGLLISGWGFTLHAPIVGVQAFFGVQLLGTVTYGYARPDVLAMYQHPNASNCGFWGFVNFPVSHDEDGLLTIRATDLTGSSIEKSVPIRLRVHPEPDGAIERATWRDDLVEVSGWAVLPGGVPPFSARVFIDDAFVGQTRVTLSRPDIWRRFARHRHAVRSGFAMRQAFMAPKASDGALHELAVELTDARGNTLRRALHITRETPLNVTGIAPAWEALARVFEEYQGRSGLEPTILDLHTGLDLAARFPDRSIFAPPVDQDSALLPYLDRTTDIAVCIAGDAMLLAEAERVAAGLVVLLHGLGGERYEAASESGALAVEARWREMVSADTGVAPLPTWSIVIPVYNQADHTERCLAQLAATLPAGAQGEIIVVDDASTDDTPAILRRWSAIEPRLRVISAAENQGFIASCNRGAKAATGDVLVFLNNDTLPRPGWLFPLLRVLRDRPDAGAVGGKLLFPDGSLQEAGGVIYDDATGYNFGKYSPTPNAPLFNHLRTVDYCSGALLATWRALFEQIGGFDTIYTPAYYEDADYCFTVRKYGLNVYYQPESEIIHVEGATSGTDLSSGTKRYQVVNRIKFLEKWRTVLADQPTPAERFDLATLFRFARRASVEGDIARG